MDYEFTGEQLPNDHSRRLKSLKHALELLELILCSLSGINDTNHEGGASESATWIPERIFLFGFSAGGSLAMEMCRMWMTAGRSPLGGSICVAGGIQTEMELLGMTKSNHQSMPTDVLIIAGERDETYPKETALLSKQFYHSSHVQLHVQKGKGHSMIGSKDEVQLIMEFLSKRLVRRLVSLESCSR
jgi:dienelactone hydrolase